jgi:threonine dehydrogenase-like Zn-dependent dehydrogenase
MRALVVSDRLTFTSDYAMPEPPAGEALIRVTRAGICNTDVEILKGYFGFKGVLGHEFVGVVERTERLEIGDSRLGNVLVGETRTQSLIANLQSPLPNLESPISIGDRVVGEINCVPCDSPSRNYFERAQDPMRNTLGIDRRDGAFADYTTLPIVNLHRVPDGVSDDEAVFVEPLAAACQIVEQVHVKPADRVAMIGDGKLGLLCAQVLATVPCDLIALGRHANKLDILRRRGIHTKVVSPDETMARQFDVVVECTGSAAGFDAARQMLRPRGTLVLKSTYQGLPQANLTALVVDEITVVGSRCGPFAPALRLLEQKRVDVQSLIHARFPLSQGAEAIAHAQKAGVLKVLLEIE